MADLTTEFQHLKDLFNKISIHEVMNPDPATINQNANLSQAQEIFKERKVSHLLVIKNEDQLAGLLTPKYLYKTHAPKRIIGEESTANPNYILDGNSYFIKQQLDGYILKSIMWKDPVTHHQDDLLSSALISMNKFNTSCIPVLNDEKKVCGVLTNQEIINFITKPLI